MTQRNGESQESYLARARKRQREYRSANLEIVQAANREYCKKNREKKRAYDKQRYAENPEPMKAYQSQYRQQHKEVINARTAKWRQANAEKVRDMLKDWFKRHPGYYAEVSARRKAAKLATQNGRVDYKRILERDKDICGICGAHVEKGTLSFDHIIPLAKGGPHIETNIQVAHLKCNIRKGDRLMRRQGSAGEALV